MNTITCLDFYTKPEFLRSLLDKQPDQKTCISTYDKLVCFDCVMDIQDALSQVKALRNLFEIQKVKLVGIDCRPALWFNSIAISNHRRNKAILHFQNRGDLSKHTPEKSCHCHEEVTMSSP